MRALAWLVGLVALVVVGWVVVAPAPQPAPDPGRVIEKVTEGLEITGEHYVLCRRKFRTTKDHVPFDQFQTITIGDPC